VRRPLFGVLGAVYPKADWAPRMFRAKTTFEGMAEPRSKPISIPCRSCAARCARSCSAIASAANSPATAREDVFVTMPRRAGTDDPLALIQYLDLKTYLVGDINTKVDRASMAHSLEVREPLMDHAGRMDGDAAVVAQGARQEGKFCSRRRWSQPAARHPLSPENGFSPCRWRAGSAARCGNACARRCSVPRLAETGWFNQDYLQHLVDAHQSGARDYSAPLWTVLMFEAFLRNVLDAACHRKVSR
jgi:asparagine synthase (glutamine-hydrolysing)